MPKPKQNKRFQTLLFITFAAAGALILFMANAAVKKPITSKPGAETIEGLFVYEHRDDFERRRSVDSFYIQTDDGRRIPIDFIGKFRPNEEAGKRVKIEGKLLNGRFRVLPFKEKITIISELKRFVPSAKADTKTASLSDRPSAPTNLAATFPRARRIQLSWDSSTYSTADSNFERGYNIFRDGALYTYQDIQPGEIQKFIDEVGISNSSETHTFYVTAVGSVGGESERSNTITATSPAAYKVAVILYQFTNTNVTSPTKETAKGVVFSNSNSVSEFYKEMSFGKAYYTGHLNPAGDVFGRYRINYASTPCNEDRWTAAAEAMAAADGFSKENYDLITLVYPGGHCASGAAGSGGYPYSYIYSFSAQVIAHEHGHGMGWGHAGVVTCYNNVDNIVPISGICRDWFEYGDGNDVMNIALKHASNFRKNYEGWYGNASLVDVTASGTHELSAAGPQTGSPKVLRILREKTPAGQPGLYYFLEYRRPYGQFDNFASTSPSVNGVTLRVAQCGACQSYKIGDPIAVGQTITDPITNISIRTNSVNGISASVTINVGTPITDTTPPTIPSNFTADKKTTNSIELKWGYSADQSLKEPVNYHLYRDGELVDCDYSPGYNQTGKAFSCLDENVTPGKVYGYQMKASDPYENLSAATPTVTQFTYPTDPPPSDITPPGAPTNVRMTGRTNNSITIAWNAPSDNDIVGYNIYRRRRADADNFPFILIKRTDSPATSYQDNDPALLPLDNYYYKVSARDLYYESLSSEISPPMTLCTAYILGNCL